MRLFVKYLEEIGANCTVPVFDPKAAQSLPVFIGQLYQIHRANLFDRDYVLLVCQNEDRPTPAEIEKHFGMAQSVLGPNVAFVFSTLPTFDRKRLIQRRIPFVVPGRQAYLPAAVIDLREMPKGGRRDTGTLKDHLSAPAQVMLLFHLYEKEDTGEWPLGKWVDVLGYSRSTIARAYKELAALTLCMWVVHGRQVNIVFPHDRQDLWKSALPYLTNPVRTQIRVRLQDEKLDLHEAGITALARLTMIGSDREKVYAMSSSAFEAARKDQRLILADYPEEDTVLVQRWKYAPDLLASDREMVDRLSLYLSLKDDHDERIQGALTELLEQVEW